MSVGCEGSATACSVWYRVDTRDVEVGATGVASQHGIGTIEGQGPFSMAHGAEAAASSQQGMAAGAATEAAGAARSPRIRLRAKVRCRVLMVMSSGSTRSRLVNRAYSEVLFVTPRADSAGSTHDARAPVDPRFSSSAGGHKRPDGRRFHPVAEWERVDRRRAAEAADRHTLMALEAGRERAGPEARCPVDDD